MRTNRVPYIGLFILFFINSALTFFFMTIYLFSKKESKAFLRYWAVLGCLFVSLFCATKVPENDLGWIVENYHQIPYTSFSDYLTLLGKEPLYQTISYGLNILLMDNEKLFIFMLSIISLGLLLGAFINVENKIPLTQSGFVFSVCLMLFFPFFFGQPVHIVRQTMAFSLFIFAFSLRFFSDRKWLWLIGLASPFIHSSCALFIPFLFFPLLNRPIKGKIYFLYACIIAALASIQLIAAYLLPFISNESLQYAFSRAGKDTTFESRLNIYQVVITGVLGLLPPLYFFVIKKTEKRDYIYYLVNFYFIVEVFVLLATGQLELQARFNMVMFQSLALISIIFLKMKNLSANMLNLFSVLIIFVWFYYQLYVSPWEYECLDLFLAYPLPTYLI